MVLASLRRPQAIRATLLCNQIIGQVRRSAAPARHLQITCGRQSDRGDLSLLEVAQDSEPSPGLVERMLSLCRQHGFRPLGLSFPHKLSQRVFLTAGHCRVID